MNEHIQKELEKALSLKYWTVEKGLYYLIQFEPTSSESYYFQNGGALLDITSGNLDNYARMTKQHNKEVHLKVATRYDDLKALWHDTDHEIRPRKKSSHPNDNDAEFEVQYFISWAQGKYIKISWLDWANEEHLLLKIKGPQSMAASKGGQARALVYQGAREACREEAKAFRKDKKGDEILSLDDCARVISEDRDDFEARHNVKLPAERTIRGYLTHLS